MIHTDGVARELVKKGHEVEVIIQRSNKKLQFPNTPYDITYLPGYTYSSKGQAIYSLFLSNTLRKKGFNLVHAKNPFSSVLTSLIIKKLGIKIKIVYDIRGLWVDFGILDGHISKRSGHFINKIDLLCMKKSDRVIAISHELRKILIERGAPSRKIDVIVGDGVDTEHIRNLHEKNVRDIIGTEGKILGYIGSISQTRSSHEIIKAFKYVQKKVDNVKLVMIGPIDHRDKDFFKRVAKKNDSIHLLGFFPLHDNLLELVKSFDIALAYHQLNLPCFNVMVPTKILEYMASGVSIIATNHKSHRNLLAHEITGYLTDKNPVAFAKGIITVLKDKIIAKRIAQNAYEKAEEYSFNRITDKIETIYSKISSLDS